MIASDDRGDRPMNTMLAMAPSRRTLLVALGTLLVAGYAAFGLRVNAAEEAKVIPPYQADASTPAAQTEEVAVLAGGCFWGVQGVFQHVNGVTSAVSGYAGGEKGTAQYELVGSGST